MQYQLAPLFCRPWTLNGITPRLIESHYEGNYGSALRRLNAITEELEALDDQHSAEVVNRLKRDEAAMLNSTLLHELYFASLGRRRADGARTMATALARDFGSTDRWRHKFIALAEALAGGSGWVLLDLRAARRPADQPERRRSQPEHRRRHPNLALDMYEHAYHIDFAPTPRPMSRPSCATSTGPRSRAARRMRPGWRAGRSSRNSSPACRP